MEDHELLQHLLSLEAEAAALVNDAQAEADRRVAEGEKENRALHDDTYAREVKELEQKYTQDLTLLKENYQKQLDEYRESLRNVSLNTGAFFSLAEDLLFKTAGPHKETQDAGHL